MQDLFNEIKQIGWKMDTQFTGVRKEIRDIKTDLGRVKEEMVTKAEVKEIVMKEVEGIVA